MAIFGADGTTATNPEIQTAVATSPARREIEPAAVEREPWTDVHDRCLVYGSGEPDGRFPRAGQTVAGGNVNVGGGGIGLDVATEQKVKAIGGQARPGLAVASGVDLRGQGDGIGPGVASSRASADKKIAFARARQFAVEEKSQAIIRDAAMGVESVRIIDGTRQQSGSLPRGVDVGAGGRIDA